MALAHEPLGKPGGPGLFHHKGEQLPAFIQHVARDLMHERGMPESEAIATAVAQCRRWAAGGEDVKPETRAKAAAAIAEWDRLKAGTHARRSTPVSEGYDADGLDASWDGDLGDLPDLTGLDVADFEALDGGSSDAGVSRAARLGSGGRFKALKGKLAAKGAHDPGALAAYIGRKKYGRAKFASLAGKARGHKGGGMHRSSYDEWIRPTIPLEDIRIVSRAEGDAAGTLVEAYATVFDEPAEIKDGQGHYKEIIDRTAFDHELSRIRRSRGGFAANVKVLYNHGKTMEGVPAPEFQLPLGVPEDIRPETRGLLTRTRFDTDDPFTERVLSKVRAGAITSYSFVGGIMRSSPELDGPGRRYRARNGSLTTVRRMMLGLREYGPVLFPAYTGAEILGVRMSIPGGVLDEIGEDVPDSTEAGEYVPDMEGDVAAATRGEVDPSRHHQHALYALRSRELREKEGLIF